MSLDAVIVIEGAARSHLVQAITVEYRVREQNFEILHNLELERSVLSEPVTISIQNQLSLTEQMTCCNFAVMKNEMGL